MTTYLLLRNPQEALMGETIDVRHLKSYEEDLWRAEIAAWRAKIKADALPSGKAKGLAKNEERKANVAVREAASRFEIARQLEKRGFTKIQFR